MGVNFVVLGHARVIGPVVRSVIGFNAIPVLSCFSFFYDLYMASFHVDVNLCVVSWVKWLGDSSISLASLMMRLVICWMLAKVSKFYKINFVSGILCVLS